MGSFHLSFLFVGGTSERSSGGGMSYKSANSEGVFNRCGFGERICTAFPNMKKWPRM